MILAEIIGPDMLIILAIVALLFGSKQLPKLARSLGSAKSQFEKGLQEGHEESPPASVETHEQVTMTRAELDHLIADADAKRDAPRSDDRS